MMNDDLTFVVLVTLPVHDGIVVDVFLVRRRVVDIIIVAAIEIAVIIENLIQHLGFVQTTSFLKK